MFAFMQGFRAAEYPLDKVNTGKAVSENSQCGRGSAADVQEGSIDSCELCTCDSVSTPSTVGVDCM